MQFDINLHDRPIDGFNIVRTSNKNAPGQVTVYNPVDFDFQAYGLKSNYVSAELVTRYKSYRGNPTSEIKSQSVVFAIGFDFAGSETARVTEEVVQGLKRKLQNPNWDITSGGSSILISVQEGNPHEELKKISEAFQQIQEAYARDETPLGDIKLPSKTVDKTRRPQWTLREGMKPNHAGIVELARHCFLKGQVATEYDHEQFNTRLAELMRQRQPSIGQAQR